MASEVVELSRERRHRHMKRKRKSSTAPSSLHCHGQRQDLKRIKMTQRHMLNHREAVKSLMMRQKRWMQAIVKPTPDPQALNAYVSTQSFLVNVNLAAPCLKDQGSLNHCCNLNCWEHPAFVIICSSFMFRKWRLFVFSCGSPLPRR